MSDAEHAVRLTAGVPSTVLPAEDSSIHDALQAALGIADDAQRRAAVGVVVAGHPRSLFAWASAGDVAADPVSRYAAYRVGYHRGLDALRANGWRGSGYVRWADPSNRGFLRCLAGLAQCADEIDERDEAERCQLFLSQLDPGFDPAAVLDGRELS